MSANQIEARLARVERDLDQLKSLLADKSAAPWWRQILGDFKDDKAFADIVRLGRQIRRKNRPG